jgi:molybdate-binding protein
MADSHFQVARRIAEGQADVGIGVRSAANLFDLSFIPLQQSRYDLVVPKAYLSVIPSIGNLFDAIVSRQFRTEIEALGGYDTTETGKIRQLRR